MGSQGAYRVFYAEKEMHIKSVPSFQIHSNRYQQVFEGEKHMIFPVQHLQLFLLLFMFVFMISLNI